MNSITMRQVFAETLVKLAETTPRLCVLDADVSSSTMTRLFAHAYPERFMNFGIQEGNMVAAAAGMATCGDIPVVSTFAFLLAARALDPVHSLISYNKLNVKLAGAYAGLSPFADGASHQSICDLAVMRALPDMRVLVPSDMESTRAAVEAMVTWEGPVYMRLSRDAVGSLHGGGYALPAGGASLLKRGKDVLLVCAGTITSAALQAAERLADEGISVSVLECVCVKPLDEKLLASEAAKHACVVTVEEHSTIGGLGDAVLSALAGAAVPVCKIGLQDTFGQSGAYEQLLARYGLDAPGIAAGVRAFMKKTGV